jgi:hypothetical protein
MGESPDYGATHLAVADDDPLGIERPPSIGRKFAEVLLYLPVLTSVFMEYLKIIQVRYAAGTIHLGCEALGLLIILMHRERLPLTFWFGVLFNLGANITQVVVNNQMPIMGKSLPPLMFYLGNLMLTCFVIQNKTAMKRVILFYTILMFVIAASGGAYMRTHQTLRMGFEGIGGGMGNPNSVAYMTGSFAICLLFWSLRATKAIRPVLWVLAFVLFLLLLRTVSRTGISLFFLSFFLLVLAIMSGKGMRIGGLVLIGFCLLLLSQFAYLLADQMIYIGKRMELKTAEGRLGIYAWSTIGDLINTAFLGVGPERAIVTSTGIAAHNSFVYAHQAYGGITAWPYLLWLGILATRIFKMFKARDLTIDVKLWVLALFGVALGGELTNNVNLDCYCSVFAWAMTEKYAVVPYSSRAIAQRRYDADMAAYPQHAQAAFA